jgi:hypothetical protein
MMKKNLLFIVLFLSSCILLIAQEKNFNDFLRHCRKVTFPLEIANDTIIFSTNSGKITDTQIPEQYVRQFICSEKDSCEHKVGEYRYNYGVYARVEDVIVVLVSKFCYNCFTIFGEGSGNDIILLYNPKGKKTGNISIKSDDQHFHKTHFIPKDTPEYILSICVEQGTIEEDPLGKSDSFYRGKVEYLAYSINGKGEISCRKTKSEKVIAKLNPEHMWWTVVKKGW